MIPRTKIIATLGPASSTYATLRKMMLSGLDVARFNFSHSSLKEHKKRLQILKLLNKKYRRHIKTLGDLEGFRIRIGELKAPLNLKKRDLIYLVKGCGSCNKNKIPFDYLGDFKSFKRNQEVFIDDGNLVLKIIKVANESLQCRVEAGGVLKSRKGVNIPSAKFKFSNLSTKDLQDIEFCIKNRVDYIAQSFVRNKNDIAAIKDILRPKLPSCKVIAKIENKEGISNIDEIIDESDGIMIARGDMGVSLPIYQIDIIQKEIIAKCNKKNKFVITATQMLESMTEHLRPTRAEVSDITNAILDGSDFLMLSAETAVGKFPVEAVDMMNKIIKFTESSSIFKRASQRNL